MCLYLGVRWNLTLCVLYFSPFSLTHSQRVFLRHSCSVVLLQCWAGLWCWCFLHTRPDRRALQAERRWLTASTQHRVATSLKHDVSFPLRQHHTICHAELCGEKAVVKVSLHRQKCPKSRRVLRRDRTRGRSARLGGSGLVDDVTARSSVLLWSLVMVASCSEFGERNPGMMMVSHYSWVK